MKAMLSIQIPGREAPSLMVPTGANRAVRAAEQLVVRPMLAGEAAVMARVGGADEEVLHTDTLQGAIRFAEQTAARFSLPAVAPELRGPSVIAKETMSLDVLGQWVEYRRKLLMLGDAREAYQLLSGQFHAEGFRAIKRAGRRRITLSAALTNMSMEAESAWDLAMFRLRNHGKVPVNATLGIPYDTCPCCLSRFLLILDNGNRHCQECAYADPER